MHSAISSIGSQELIVIAIIGLIALGSIALWIWSLIHCIRNKQLTDNNRIIGIILIVVLGLIGSLIYLFLPREPINTSSNLGTRT